MQLGIPCIDTSFGYARALVWSISITARKKNDISIIFTVPNGEGIRYIEMVESFGMLANVIEIDTGKKCNRSHGEALNILFESMTHDVCGFIDCDVVMLMKHWDNILTRYLTGDAAIIGSEYWQKNKYGNFPNVIFCLFKRKLLEDCHVDFSPYNFYRVNCNLMADIYSRPVGHKLLLDTGYELPLKLKSNGYEGVCLTPIRSFARKAVVRTRKHKKAGEEYHLDGKPVCTHFRRCAEFKYTHRRVSEWRKNIMYYLRKMKIA